jgi:hypothetical protein
MALASTTAANAALNGLDGTGSVNQMTHASLHTATTGTTGASEATGGGYARLAATWNAAAASAKTNSSAFTFTTTGSTANTHLGTWNALTVGTFAIGAALGASVTAVTVTVAAGAVSLTAA